VRNEVLLGMKEERKIPQKQKRGKVKKIGRI
jgi:hypothetical protein